MRLQIADIIVEFVHPVHHHAALDSAFERTLLISREINSAGRTEQGINLCQRTAENRRLHIFARRQLVKVRV